MDLSKYGTYDRYISISKKFHPERVCYITLMGSRVYGCHNEDSDYDYYGFYMPTPEQINPMAYGYVEGIDEPKPMDNWRLEGDDSEVTLYALPRYLKLLAGGHPNMIESLFTRKVDHLIRDNVGDLIYNRRYEFISKATFVQTLNYARSQVKRVDRKSIGMRKVLCDQFGYDVKSAAHSIRLIDNSIQLLQNGFIVLDNIKDTTLSIRAGNWSLDRYKLEVSIALENLEDAERGSALKDSVDIEFVKHIYRKCTKIFYEV